MQKNIVRHMIVGQPVVIGARPKPVVEEPEPDEVEQEPEKVEESKGGIPKEILDKVFAEIEEIERKEKLTEETLREAHKEKAQSTQLKKQAEEIKEQAEQLKAQAEKQAKEMLDKATAESEKIVNDTKAEAKELLDKVQKEGYDAGYKDGKAKGIKDGREKIEDELKNIIRQANDKAQKTLRDAKEQTAEYFIRAEDDIVAVVVMAIEKILPQHFLDSPQVILPVVREAIKHVRDQKEVKVHVDPDSYDLVLMARTEFQSMLTDGTATVEVISDDALKPGDCVIETPNGGVDARLSTQIGLMKRAVESVLNK
ncbi:MAG: flagellar assembly protein FliH [Selenomonadaceae bacterium]|nr:flagellar assembly protein FliH [Selenomonadaceae bacterium]MBQ6758513.1 flagellar assembly protein FliH [Selenomonadaceae bacterium]